MISFFYDYVHKVCVIYCLSKLFFSNLTFGSHQNITLDVGNRHPEPFGMLCGAILSPLDLCGTM